VTTTRDPQLRADRVTQRFGLRTIFSNVTLELGGGDVLAVTGHNGSGKSTLLKIFANVSERSGGTMEWRLNGSALSEEDLPQHLGFVAPYLQLYNEFTAVEHVDLMQQMRGLATDRDRVDELFETFGLASRRNDVLRTFSSGMLQRVKFICALIHDPPFLLLDEPTTNFDEQGIATVRELVAARRESRVTVIATNDPTDLSMCTKRLSLERAAQPLA